MWRNHWREFSGSLAGSSKSDHNLGLLGNSFAGVVGGGDGLGGGALVLGDLGGGPAQAWGDLVGGDLRLRALLALVVLPMALVEAALNYDPVSPADAASSAA